MFKILKCVVNYLMYSSVPCHRVGLHYEIN